MKKVLFLALLLSAATVFGQNVPKHEFSFSLSYSPVHTYICSIPKEESSYVKGRAYDGQDAMVYSPIQFEYTCHFNDNWGFSTGLGVEGFAVRYLSTGTHNYYIERIHHTIEESSTSPAQNPVTLTECGVAYSFSKEQHELTEEFIVVPVLLRYRQSFGNGKWNWYAQGGVKLGARLYGAVSSSADNEVGTSKINIYMYRGNYQLQNDNEAKISYNSKYDLIDSSDTDDELRRFMPFASIETGIRIPVWGKLGIYAGVFADLGLLRAVKATNTYMFEGGDSLDTSPFGARSEVPHISITEEDRQLYYTLMVSDKPLVRGVLPCAAGFKLRIAL